MIHGQTSIKGIVGFTNEHHLQIPVRIRSNLYKNTPLPTSYLPFPLHPPQLRAGYCTTNSSDLHSGSTCLKTPSVKRVFYLKQAVHRGNIPRYSVLG